MTTRREFIRSAALASAGLAFSGITSKMTAQSFERIAGANSKVNVAFVGIGNRGLEVLNEFVKTGMVNVVALCDIAAKIFEDGERYFVFDAFSDDLKIETVGQCNCRLHDQ